MLDSGLPGSVWGGPISILLGGVGGPRGQDLVRREAEGPVDWVCCLSSSPFKGEAGGSDTWDGVVTLEWGQSETLELPNSPETVELGRNPPLLPMDSCLPCQWTWQGPPLCGWFIGQCGSPLAVSPGLAWWIQYEIETNLSICVTWVSEESNTFVSILREICVN